VDHVESAKKEIETNGNQRVRAPDQEGIDHLLKDLGHCLSLRLLFRCYIAD